MKVALMAFTQSGIHTGMRIIQFLEQEGHSCMGYWKSKSREIDGERLNPVSCSLHEWTERQFQAMDALIFVSAAGIAVRAIAPFVKSKKTDPACIVIDEQGTYVIPLLSGHIGGANALARQIGGEIHGIPIITTATDINHLFAVDEWARENRMHITDLELAKQISAFLLQGKSIGVFSQFPLNGPFPEGLHENEILEMNLEISIASSPRTPNALQLIPRCMVLGIGCRRGTPKEAIEAFLSDVLKEHRLSEKAVLQVASIDLKEHEEGLVDFCKERKLPFQVFTSQQLSATEGPFSASAFVRSVTGVDNVCERAAVLGSQGGKLLIKKQSGNGVTLAACIKEQRYSFSPCSQEQPERAGAADKADVRNVAAWRL